MDVTLVIPAFDEERWIGACLDSVLRQQFREVIVVDNASRDATGAIARSKGVRVLCEERKGLTRARQCGYEAATSEFVAYVDADTQMPETWFARLECLHARYPTAVSYSGPARYSDGSRVQRLTLALLWWFSAPLVYRLVGYMLFGANFVVRRSALDAIGGFDTSLEFFGEDMTLARRLAPQGRTIFSMDFVVYASLRRFAQEGMLHTNARYALNAVWPVLFGRPYTHTHRDARG